MITFSDFDITQFQTLATNLKYIECFITMDSVGNAGKYDTLNKPQVQLLLGDIVYVVQLPYDIYAVIPR